MVSLQPSMAAHPLFEEFFHCVEALGAVVLDISRQAITLWLVCWVDAALDGKSSESDRPVIRIPNH